MSRFITSVKLSLVVLSALTIGSGCSVFRASVQNEDVNKASAKPLDTGYDFGDLRSLAEAVNSELVSAPVLEKKPILVVMGIENRTDEHVDTKAITDTIRTRLINEGKASFINESRRDALMKEQGYQLVNCTPETQTLIGKQLGARYMLTGSLVKISKDTPKQISLSRKEQVYLQLTIEVTDLQTGLIAWTTQKERVRGASKPVLGW
ncbi:MAG: hypothetical protein WCI95_04160 [bacterium]